MNSDNIVAITIPIMFSWVAWIIFSTIRRYKIAKLQADVQTKLLDKVGSGPDLLAYAQTEAGKELLESLKVERHSPHSRIIGALQTSIVMISLGAAFPFSAWEDSRHSRRFPGVRHVEHYAGNRLRIVRRRLVLLVEVLRPAEWQSSIALQCRFAFTFIA
jgi:hypothetical protein